MAKFLLSLLNVFYAMVLWAQAPVIPIREWQSKLSVKKDVCAVNRREVYNSILAIDSADRCKALHALDESGGDDEKRFRIRMNIIKTKFGIVFGSCSDYKRDSPTPEESLQKAYELGDDQLAAELNLFLGWRHWQSNEYSVGIMYLLMGWDLIHQEGIENFYEVPLFLYGLADAMYKSRDYRGAVKFNKLAIDYRILTKSGETDTLSNDWAKHAWNNLGLCYERLQVYDSAFMAFNHAYEVATDSEKAGFWGGLIKGNRGDVFFLEGNYDSAIALLQFDYEKSIATQNVENAALSLHRLALIRNSTGDHTGALSMLRESQKLMTSGFFIDYHKSILEAMAVVFRDLGEADSVYVYLNKAKKYELIIEKQAAENKMDIVELRMNNENNIHRILQLNREKNQIKLIRNFIIAIAIMGAILGLLIYNRQRLRLKLRQKEALEDKERAEREAKSAHDQLQVFTQRFLEKTTLVEKLQDDLKQRELNEEQHQYINQLSQHSILTDSDWDQFKHLFEKVYPGFLIRLKNEVPDITLAEQRMAALSKLQVPAKEAATLLGISPNSVNKTRQRLRHRLGLNAETDLEAYFSSFTR